MATDVHSRYLRGISFYDGHKLDTSDLDLPSYIDERIAANEGGGSGYLVADLLVSQGGTAAPTIITISDDTGKTNPSRFAVGKYIIATGLSINNTIYGFTPNVVDVTMWMSIDGSGNLILEVYFLNGDGTYSPEDGDLNKTPVWFKIKQS